MKLRLIQSFYVAIAVLLIVRIILAPKTLTNQNEFWEILGEKIRSKAVTTNQRIWIEPTASLVSGVLWGEKATFSPQFKRDLSRVGMSHVVVASGFNLVMMVGFISAVLKDKTRKNDAIIILMIALYMIITGFQPPIIRAGLMVGISILARFLGRPVFWLNPLLLAASALILLQPEIIYSLSFQLSFMATLGLITTGKLVGKLNGLKFPLINAFVQTLAAQLFTLPIILANFGNYSIVSILANTILLWTIPWLMIGGVFAGFIGFLNLPLGRFVGLPVQGLGMLFQTIVSVFSNLSFSVIRFETTDLTFSLGYYSVLFGVLFWFMNRNNKFSQREVLI